jgi:hypothetical protein
VLSLGSYRKLKEELGLQDEDIVDYAGYTIFLKPGEVDLIDFA